MLRRPTAGVPGPDVFCMDAQCDTEQLTAAQLETVELLLQLHSKGRAILLKKLKDTEHSPWRTPKDFDDYLMPEKVSFLVVAYIAHCGKQAVATPETPFFFYSAHDGRLSIC